MARLRIEFAGTQTVVSLKGAETTVGRSNRCTIHLPDPALGPIHFRIQEKSRGYRLKDDGSGAGTRVNGKPVYATTLAHGDVIEAGALRCTFLSGKEQAIPVAPPADEFDEIDDHEPEDRPAPRRNVGKIVLFAGAVVALAGVVAFLALRRSADDEAAALWKQAQAVLAEATGAATEPKLREADALLARITGEFRKARITQTAAVKHREVKRVLQAFAQIEVERALLHSTMANATPLEGHGTQSGAESMIEMAMRARLGKLRRLGNPALLEAIAVFELEIDQLRSARLRALYAQAEKASREHFANEKYAEAAAVWRDLQIPDYFLQKRVTEAQADVEKRTLEAYRVRLRLAGRSPELDARIGLLEACRPIFKGTRHAEDLEVRISALRAQRTRADIVVLDKPKKPKTDPKKPKTGTPTPEPVVAGPYEDPPKVAAQVKQRRYAEAAATLQSISRHPAVVVRTEELTLLANLMADLVGAVNEKPTEFHDIVLPNRVGRGDALGADNDVLKVVKDGSRTQYSWDSLPAKSFVRLFRQAGFDKPPRLATALFFDEEDLPKEAQADYVAFFKSEQAPTTLTRILARRRGIEPPDGGFLLFRGQIVTPEEKARILLDEEIAVLAKKAKSTNERIRNKAWEDLEKLGEPALEALVQGVKHRRQFAAEELKSSRAFTPARFVSKFGKDLAQRREYALAFIMDAKAYPYPNKIESAQKEAERRVDAVRELYETPFDELLAASEPAQLLNQEIGDLDVRLAKLEPFAEPIQEQVVEEITKKLDMRMVAIDESDRKRIAYNVEVEKYNAELKDTSVDSEERDNTKAVNEYRWMMGRHSVKIDERLVRASRKHSIEMQQLKYFAHDSPTPSLKNPGVRGKREGYGGGVAENIARGASTGREAFKQWFGSSGHHRNMLIEAHTEMGCGAAQHHWWTQNFGRATGRSLNPPRVPPDPDPPGQSGNGKPAPQ